MTNRSKLLSTVASAAIAVWLSSASARAADVVAADAFDWSGFYIGAHIGYGEADVTFKPHESETGDGVADLNLDGILGGIHGGMNWQSDGLVFGIEADISAVDWSKSGDFSGNSSREAAADIDFLASIRPRLGLAMDQAMIYVTGGVAFADGEYTAISPAGTVRKSDELSIGGVVGGGAEFAITDNVIARVEGLYYIFDDKVSLGASGGEDDPPNRAELDDAIVVRAGLSLKL